MQKPVYTVVLAAGKGTRMKSDLPKVLHKLGGRPMIHYVLDSIGQAGLSQVVVVVGHGREQVIESVHNWQKAASADMQIEFAVQAEQKGTGHAVQTGQGYLPAKDAYILVLLGDVPMIRPETVREALQEMQQDQAAAMVLTMNLEKPGGYGRILRDLQGNITGIREEKDASEQEKLITEVNTGIFIFNSDELWPHLARLQANNAQGELYLTDMVEILQKEKLRVVARNFANPLQFEGINSPEQLAAMEKLVLQEQR